MELKRGRPVLPLLLAVAVLTLAACDFWGVLGSDSYVSDREKLVTVVIQAQDPTIGLAPLTVTHETPNVQEYVLFGGAVRAGRAELARFATLDNATVALASGRWDFTLEGRDIQDRPVLSGEQTNVMIGTTPITITFVLKTLVTGTGAVAVTVTWPAQVEVAAVVASFGGTDVTSALIVAASSVTYTNAEAAAGDHILVFRFYDADGDLMSTVFEVVWVRGNLASAKTIELLVTDFNGAPPAPTAVFVTRVPNTTLSTNTLNLTWTDASNTETGFHVAYSDDGGATWSAEEIVAAASESFVGTAPRGVSRGYRVRAFNNFGDSDWALTPAVEIPWLVSFASQGGSAVAAVEVAHGALVHRPPDPTRDDYWFVRWNHDAAGAIPWHFDSDSVTGSSTLYASWLSLNDVTVTFSISNPEYGAITFTNPAPSVPWGESITFTTTMTDGSAWRWYVNNVDTTVTTPTFVWNATPPGVQPGHYLINVEAMYGGYRCSGSVRVTVVH